jgi:anti-sigma factor RsiW
MKECLDEATLQGYFDGELSRVAAARAASHLAACMTCAAAAREIQSEMSLLATALQPELAVSVPTETLRGRIDDAIAELQSERTVPDYAVPAPGRSGFTWLSFFPGFPRRAFSYAAVLVIIVTAVALGVIYLKREAVTSGVERAQNQPPVHAASPQSSPIVSTPPNTGAPDQTPVVVVGPVNALKKTLPRHTVREPESTATLLPGERSYVRTIAALNATIKSKGQPMRPGLQVEYEHNLAVVDQAIAATRAAAQKNPKDPDAAQFVIAAYQSKIDLMTQVADARLFDTQRR